MKKVSAVTEELLNLDTIHDLFIVDPAYNRGITAAILVKIHTADIKGVETSTPYWIPVNTENYCMTVQGKPVLVRGIKPEQLSRVGRFDIFVDRDQEIISETEFRELCEWLAKEYRMRQETTELDQLRKRVRTMERMLGMDFARDEMRYEREEFELPRRIRETIIEAYF